MTFCDYGAVVEDLVTIVRMLELSPAMVSQSADGAMFRAPSLCPIVRNSNAAHNAQVLKEQIRLELQHLKAKQWSSKVPFQGKSPFSAPHCIQHDDILTACSTDHILKGQMFRFSSDLYQPSNGGLNKLSKKLTLAAKVSGGTDLGNQL